MRMLEEYKALYGLQNYRFIWIRGGSYVKEVAVIAPGVKISSEFDNMEIHAALNCWLDVVNNRKVKLYLKRGSMMFDSWNEFLEHAIVKKLAGI